MRSTCDYAECPCGGRAWIEERQHKVFHECASAASGGSKAHTSLHAVLQCKSCKLKRNWKRHQLPHQEEEFSDVSIRIRTTATRPTAAGVWHSLSQRKVELLPHAVVVRGMGHEDETFTLEYAGRHQLTCALQQDVVTIGVSYASRDQVLMLREEFGPIECFALQFSAKPTAVAFNNQLVRRLPSTAAATATTMLPKLPPGNLLHLLLDPTLDSLIEHAEMVLSSGNSELLPAFTQTIDFTRLCAKVEHVLDKRARRG
ncbi:hypothetical protein BASA81_002935 [Batrachochytrium salamandrivorans]|nr:hypothetical protein BASA81_002935 [Batrachochytrium salamandrivorans]